MNTETKFTKGPWKAINMEGDTFPSVVFHGKREGMNGCYIVVNSAHPQTLAGCQANAKLIAASPELYEAMQGFVDNALSDKRIAENQIVYYKGVFTELLNRINS